MIALLVEVMLYNDFCAELLNNQNQNMQINSNKALNLSFGLEEEKLEIRPAFQK